MGQSLGGLELVGYNLEDVEVSQGGRLHLTLYWRVRRSELVLIAASLGDTAMEAHDLGLGNLLRYAEEYRPPRQSIVVEDYLLIVPSQIEGPYAQSVQFLYYPSTALNTCANASTSRLLSPLPLPYPPKYTMTAFRAHFGSYAVRAAQSYFDPQHPPHYQGTIAAFSQMW